MKRIKLNLFSLMIVILVTVAGLGIFSACNNNSSYVEGRYETIDGYGSITSNVLSKNNISLHVENKVETSKEVIEELFDIIENDYNKLQNAWNKKNRVNIYIIEDSYIFGINRGVYVNGNVICNLDTIRDGSYKLFLTAAYLKTTETWKQYSACQRVFSLWDTKDVDFQTYYSNDENLLSLTLFTAYFNEHFSDSETVDMAKQTSFSFGNFVLTNYGLNKFLSSNLTDYRQEWLDSIKCAQRFDIPFDLSWLDNARYSQKFLQYPLVITTSDRIYNLDAFYSKRPSSSFDTAERVLYHLSQGHSESIRVLNYIKDNAHENYSSVLERFTNQIEYFISDSEIRTYCDSNNQKIYLLDPSEYVHETIHAITLSHNPTDEAWLSEGLAEYFSRAVSTKICDINYRFYDSFTSTSLSGNLKKFVDLVNDKYENMGGSFDSIETFNFALMEEAIGLTTILYPQYKSQITFPYATNSIYQTYKCSHTDENKLTYPEAYVFTKYLIDKYGLDKVLQCCSAYDFEKVFGKAYIDEFSIFRSTIL